MKIYLAIILILFSCSGFGQNPALKVHLKDAETGKPVKDARVTLEGFELPPIAAQYNRKGKCYYFDIIPEGYNTVMACHKDYNEKGFQDQEALSADIHLELYRYRNVSYRFEEVVLTSIDRNYTKKNRYVKALEKRLDNDEEILSKNFRKIYEEDPYHIAIISKEKKHEFFNENFIKQIERLSLEPSMSITEGNRGNFQSNCYGFDYMGVLRSTEEAWNYYDDDFYFNYKVYFFHKKDKSKFKRFNSLKIEELRKLGYVVATITNLKIEYFSKKAFNVNKFYNSVNPFVYYDTDQPVDKYYQFGSHEYKQAFYSTAKKEQSSVYYGDMYGIVDDSIIENLYFVIPYNSENRPGIGLGALDIMDEVTPNSTDFYFSNSFFEDSLKPDNN